MKKAKGDSKRKRRNKKRKRRLKSLLMYYIKRKNTFTATREDPNPLIRLSILV